MGTRNRFLNFFQTFAVFLPILFILTLSAAKAQVAEGGDANVSRLMGDQEECAIAKNPTDERQLFSLCNNDSGLFASRSTDGGVTWTYPDPDDKAIADGDEGQGPQACCDPSLAWDSFGNLFITYLGGSKTNIVTIVSTDGGVTFSNLANWGSVSSVSVDQPTVVAANTSAPGAPVAVWIVWNQSNVMVARGAAVTGWGTFGAFGALQTIPVPGLWGCSFGDIAIAPTGAVVQACQSPTGGEGPATIYVNTDADGLGPAEFGAAISATTTNVGGLERIPAQKRRPIDAGAGLAFDRKSTSHFGRLYLIYTEETANENNDTDIMLRYSDDNGANWSAPIRVNDDPAAPIRSQFMPRISSDPLSGNIAVCWNDARNSETNIVVQVFCAIATPEGTAPTFLANKRIGDGSSTSNSSRDFGDYSGLDYFQGLAHPIWADTSNSTGYNPNAPAKVDAHTDRVSGGEMAGDQPLPPHVIVDNGQGSPAVVEPRSQTVLTTCNDTIPFPPWLSRSVNRNPSPEDRQEIMDLIHSYSWALDDRDDERFEELFAINAVFEACKNGGAPNSPSQIVRTTNSMELRAYIREQFAVLLADGLQTRHFQTNTILNAVDENTVEEKTTMLVTIQRANTSAPENDYTAVLKGKLTKDNDGVWRFERLTLFTDEPKIIVSKAR